MPPERRDDRAPEHHRLDEDDAVRLVPRRLADDVGAAVEVVEPRLRDVAEEANLRRLPSAGSRSAPASVSAYPPRASSSASSASSSTSTPLRGSRRPTNSALERLARKAVQMAGTGEVGVFERDQLAGGRAAGPGGVELAVYRGARHARDDGREARVVDRDEPLAAPQRRRTTTSSPPPRGARRAPRAPRRLARAGRRRDRMERHAPVESRRRGRAAERPGDPDSSPAARARLARSAVAVTIPDWRSRRAAVRRALSARRHPRGRRPGAVRRSGGPAGSASRRRRRAAAARRRT